MELNNFFKNMKTAILFLFLLSIILPSIADAQNQKKTDSLQSVLNSEKHDTMKIDALNRLFLLFEFTDTVKATNYLQQALTLSEKIGYRSGIANTYMYFGYYHEDQSRFMLAISFHQKALKIYEELHYLKGKANCYNAMGLIYLSQGNYPKALEIFQTTLALNEKLDDIKGMANTYNNIGNIHDYQGNLSQALNYYEKSLQINVKLDDKKKIASCNNNIGTIQFRLKNYKVALEYHKKSLQINEMLKNKKGMAYNYTNIGLIFTMCKKYFEAKEYYSKALKMYQELKNKKEICVVLGNIAALNNLQNKFNEAITFAEQNLQIAKNSGLLENEMDSYKELANAFEGLKNFQQAYKYHKLFKQINDSLVNTEKNEQLSRMEAIYQNEKKQKEIELKESQLIKQMLEVKQQKTKIIALAGGLVLLLILLIVIFKSYKNKHIANILLAKQKYEISEKNEELNQVNEEIKAQRDLIIEQNEELSLKNGEISSQRDTVIKQKDHIEEQKKEITDSIYYAKRIQQAVLPSDDYANNILGEHFIFFKPKDIVSGDFYWATQTMGHAPLLIVAVADCTGHGVPGAFMSMLGVSFLNEIVRKKEIAKASEVLDHLRKSIIEALQQKGTSGEQKDGMDMVLCVLNTANNQLQFAGANNPLFIVTAQKELKEIEPDKQPVAIYENMKPYTNHQIQLYEGDIIFLTSDGYEDQFGGPNNKKFMTKQLKELFINIAAQPMNEQKKILNTTFENWRGECEQIDDVTILGLRI